MLLAMLLAMRCPGWGRLLVKSGVDEVWGCSLWESFRENLQDKQAIELSLKRVLLTSLDRAKIPASKPSWRSVPCS